MSYFRSSLRNSNTLIVVYVAIYWGMIIPLLFVILCIKKTPSLKVVSFTLHTSCWDVVLFCMWPYRYLSVAISHWQASFWQSCKGEFKYKVFISYQSLSFPQWAALFRQLSIMSTFGVQLAVLLFLQYLLIAVKPVQTSRDYSAGKQLCQSTTRCLSKTQHWAIWNRFHIAFCMLYI